MASQSWGNLLNAGPPWQTTQGTALSTATTATITPQAAGSTAQDFILPTQYNGIQWYPGMTLKLEAGLTLTTGGTTTSMTFLVSCGVSGTLATTLSTTAAVVMGAGSLTGIEAILTAYIRCTALSVSAATLSCEGQVAIPSVGGATGQTLGTTTGMLVSLPYTASSFNTYTAATALGLRGTLSAAFGSMQCNTFLIWQTC